MKIKNLLPITGAILFIVIALSSCQEDMSSIGSEILGDQALNGILDESQTIVSYSRNIGPIQSNRLPVYQLGVYNDPVYGKSTVNLLSQLTLQENDPKFGDDAIVDSVFVYLPYFSKPTTVDSVTTYTLDSIYGASPISVSVRKSNYFLREYDPKSGFQEFQNYYSTGEPFEQNLGEELGFVQSFIPSKIGFIFNKGKENEEKLGPGLRMKLDSTFFQEKIINMEGKEELRNSNNFKDYLRGIYFKINSSSNDGSLILFDASSAYVSIYYSFKGADKPEEREKGVYKLNFKGQNVNTFDNEVPQTVLTAVENANTQTGDENLYLRGGDGIIAVVDLFGKDLDNNGVADDLEMLRDKKWIINEANLICYVNQDLISGGSKEPERILIYDLKNSNILADYNFDQTNGLEAVDAFTDHYGRLVRGSDDKGKYYKLKITNHISNLINKDSTNVPLGIVVSQNVTLQTTQELKDSVEPSVKEVPSSSVISPQGTIIYGNASPNQEKRLKLQIYYTEPK